MKTFFMFLILFLSVIRIQAQSSIRAAGGWAYSVPSNTISIAGNDYGNNFKITSVFNQTELTITALLRSNWIVRVDKDDINWDSRLELYVRRSSTFLPFVNGGLSFQLITDTPNLFFRGSGLVPTSIPIQYEIRGLSVLIPVDDYTMYVNYTISDN